MREFKKSDNMFWFVLVVTLTFIVVIGGCTHKPSTLEGYNLQAKEDFRKEMNEAREDNYDEMVEVHKEMMKRRMLKRAAVQAATVDVDCEWKGIVRPSIGDVKLNLTLREVNGVGASS